MAKYQDFRVLMLMGAHREHPEIPIDFDRHFMLDLSLSFTSTGLYREFCARPLILLFSRL